MTRVKIVKGALFGAVAGIIDVIPMVVQGLGWDANLSAFALWVVSGFLIASSGLQMRGCLKGLVVSVLVLLPAAILISAREPASLLPIAVMTLLLGSSLGFCIEKYASG